MSLVVHHTVNLWLAVLSEAVRQYTHAGLLIIDVEKMLHPKNTEKQTRQTHDIDFPLLRLQRIELK